MEITVRYWRGTTECEDTATSYRGAMKIASQNQNACLPTFHESGRKLVDDGSGLAYEDLLADGKKPVYAV